MTFHDDPLPRHSAMPARPKPANAHMARAEADQRAELERMVALADAEGALTAADRIQGRRASLTKRQELRYWVLRAVWCKARGYAVPAAPRWLARIGDAALVVFALALASASAWLFVELL